MELDKLKNLNILSFNWHEPYICLLARTSHKFTIVEPEVREGVIMRWRKELRLVPDNVSVVDRENATSQLEKGAFDLAICQNVKDLVFIRGFGMPKILVFHNKLTTEIELGRNKVKRDEYLAPLKSFLEGVFLVFISEKKRKDWGFDGTIITPGIDFNEYENYSGETAKVLRVGNMVMERDLMMGYTAQEEILKDVPNTLMGENPNIPGSRMSKNWNDLKSQYISHRLFLNTTVKEYEDGYNLAMLEAMATGMPVVSVANDTSPIIDSENGFISDDVSYLREKIEFLLSNKEEAKRIGQIGRQMVKEKFSLESFVDKWEAAITDAVKKFIVECSSASEVQGEKPTVNKELQEILDKANKLQTQDLGKAIETYKTAEEKFPENEEPLLKLGACMLATSRLEESESYFKKAEKLDPGSTKALTGLGFVGVQKKNPDAASGFFKKAIEQDPSNDKAVYGEGLCLWQSGKKEEALKKYCSALDINIENTQALATLTEVAFETGVFDEAEKYFKEYLSLHPANLNFLFSLAGVQFKAGKIEEAKGTLDKILLFDPNRADAIRLMKIIEEQPA